MKRPILVAAFLLVLVPLLLVTLVNSLAVAPSDTPPDPSLLITLPDGSDVPLGALLEQARAEGPTTADAGAGLELEAAGGTATDAGPAEIDGRDLSELGDEETARSVHEALERARERFSRPPAADDLLGLARHAQREGRMEQAIALYRSIPPGDRDYARAQRQLGWNVYTRGMDDPTRGIAHVNASVRANPTDGNAWQDLVRVYGHSLGLPID